MKSAQVLILLGKALDMKLLVNLNWHWFPLFSPPNADSEVLIEVLYKLLDAKEFRYTPNHTDFSSELSKRGCFTIQIRHKASRRNCSCCLLVSCLLLDISEESGASAILIILILTYSGDPSISLAIPSLPIPTVSRMSRSSTFHPLISHAPSTEGVL